MPLRYDDFFAAAFPDDRRPYGYQCRLACGPEAKAEEPGTLGAGTACESRLIDIPTGLGKTAAVVLAWLWNRQQAGSTWPRRLVYCLPMRTLVEQTRDEVRGWVERLADADLISTKPRVVVLMGGESLEGDEKDWDIHPEADTILIGTQDMLLSRALNRGYGMSRYRWPMHFALLNNDCLWVMDEVQLMGAGLGSTTQLEGFRSSSGENRPPDLGSRNCRSWWMSATIRPDWLKTVDFPAPLAESTPTGLLDTEKSDGGRIEALRSAQKRIGKAGVASGEKNAKDVAEFIDAHRSIDHLNLVVVNTIKRARSVHAALVKHLGKEDPAPILLHSQFRPADRLRVLSAVASAVPGQVVVSTQVIEAGIDLSAHTLFTELAPWSSLVQRFGRCNRWLVEGRPHFSDAAIHWFDLDEDKECLPYKPQQLSAARERLTKLSDAALANLETIPSPDTDRPSFRHVLRRKDLVELFDTTPDLAGADLDIDRFVRDADNSHVRVFWRNWPTQTPGGDASSGVAAESAPLREELCATSVGELRALLGKAEPATAWRWNHLDRKWDETKTESLFPGQTYLLHSRQGGYAEGSSEALPLGWSGDPKQVVAPLDEGRATESEETEANEDDGASAQELWQTVAQHTDDVCLALEPLLSALPEFLSSFSEGAATPLAEILRQSARWHDWGKAHPAFQAKLHAEKLVQARATGKLPTNATDAPAAKAPSDAWISGRLPRKAGPDEQRRRHFRHELASALGILHPDSDFPLTEDSARDLAAYLVATHHGKVRLSIRSLPDEWIPPIDDDHPNERRFARGVWDGDLIDSCELGGGVTAPTIRLSLEPMELGLCEADPFKGQPSWAERTLLLRDTLGIFRLAYLETLLRCADARGSKTPQPRQ
ncbi:MAG: CRISPR-associated endonuclease Cas3'' [Verrucomicrobiales bacterium]